MPVARRPIYFVTAKRCVTLVWSSNLSCKAHHIQKRYSYDDGRYPRKQELTNERTFNNHLPETLTKTLQGNPLTGTFFWVTKHTESFPRTPMEVIPAALTALKAYSKNSPTTSIKSSHLVAQNTIIDSNYDPETTSDHNHHIKELKRTQNPIIEILYLRNIYRETN